VALSVRSTHGASCHTASWWQFACGCGCAPLDASTPSVVSYAMHYKTQHTAPQPTFLPRKPAPKIAPGSLHFRRVFAHCETLSGEGTQAKKRMFNLPNRNLVENKGTLEGRTGPNRRFEPEMVRNQLNLQ